MRSKCLLFTAATIVLFWLLLISRALKFWFANGLQKIANSLQFVANSLLIIANTPPQTVCVCLRRFMSIWEVALIQFFSRRRLSCPHCNFNGVKKATTSDFLFFCFINQGKISTFIVLTFCLHCSC